MDIQWVRGSEKLSPNWPYTFFVQGIRGSGKSSLLENLACLYLAAGHTVLDLFSSRDAESLGWLRSPYVNDKKILLLHGENVDIESSYDCKATSQLSLSDFEAYDLLISSPPFYITADAEFTEIGVLLDRIYRRLYWKKLIFCVMREASNLLYSRLKLTGNQDAAKTSAIYLLREARHQGLALGLDSIRFLGIDINVRELADFVLLKSQGLSGLSSDLSWLYSIFWPHFLRSMPPEAFIILAKSGGVGVGRFDPVPWHKVEREDILREVGVKIQYGEPLEAGDYRGTFKTVGDKEHGEIVRLYLEEALSMDNISKKLGRSARTAFAHIKAHNMAVERSGFCPSCRRVGSNHSTEKAVRT